MEDFNDSSKFKRSCCNFHPSGIPSQPNVNIANGVMNSNDHDVFLKTESLNHSLVHFDQSFKPPI